MDPLGPETQMDRVVDPGDFCFNLRPGSFQRVLRVRRVVGLSRWKHQSHYGWVQENIPENLIKLGMRAVVGDPE